MDLVAFWGSRSREVVLGARDGKEDTVLNWGSEWSQWEGDIEQRCSQQGTCLACLCLRAGGE